MLDINGGNMLNLSNLSTGHLQVLSEALELHRDGLKSAVQEVMVDGTLESLDDLLEATGELQTDIKLTEEIMETISVYRT